MFNLKSLKSMFSIADISMAVITILVIALMIIPIPTSVLDLLMVVNLAISIMVLLVAMYLSEPLDFAAFPSLLLIMTLFRLSLNVSSTKLILALGADFDGDVVKRLLNL